MMMPQRPQMSYRPNMGTGLEDQPTNAMQAEQVNPGAPQPMQVQGPMQMSHPAPPQPMMAPPGYPNRQNRRTTPMGA